MERKQKILTQLPPDADRLKQAVVDFLAQIKEFRLWIEGQKKISVRVMQAYKTTVADKIDPQLAALRSELKTPSNLERILGEIESAVHRPLHLMETKLRPSVGMGVFLERWMRSQTVDNCLKESCAAIDRYVLELSRLLVSKAVFSSPGRPTDRPHSA